MTQTNLTRPQGLSRIDPALRDAAAELGIVEFLIETLPAEREHANRVAAERAAAVDTSGVVVESRTIAGPDGRPAGPSAVSRTHRLRGTAAAVRPRRRLRDREPGHRSRRIAWSWPGMPTAWWCRWTTGWRPKHPVSGGAGRRRGRPSLRRGEQRGTERDAGRVAVMGRDAGAALVAAWPNACSTTKVHRS